MKRELRQGETHKMLWLGEGVSQAKSLSLLPDVTESKHHISTCNHHDYHHLVEGVSAQGRRVGTR